MQWLNELPFGDNRVVQIGFLAACGIAALVVLAIIYRFVFAHRLRVPGGRTRQPRLGLVDAFSLDGQRQLVLVRRDNVEHLIMIGGPNDVLVESQINRALGPARENHAALPSQAMAGPGRRAEPVAIAPPASTAAPAQKAVAPPAAPVPLPSKSPALSPVASAGDIRSESAPPARDSRAAPAAPQAPPAAAPVAPAVAQVAPAAASAAPAPAASPAIAAKVVEPARPIPARPPEPRSSAARPSMPPPIPPPATPASRGNVMRPADTGRQGAPPVAPVSGNMPPASAETAAAAPRPAKAEPPVAAPKPETRPPAGAARVPVPPAQTPAAARPETPAAASASGLAPPPKVEAFAPAPNGEPASIEKTPSKADDPFAGLDSLEAEMARLLGRDRPS